MRRPAPPQALHVRAIVADGTTAFVGSQGLRKPELDERREIGLIVKDMRIARKIQSVFEADWALTKPKDEEDEEERVTEEEVSVG